MVGTFKIITLAASLEEKIVDLENDTWDDSGSITVMGANLHCWKHGGHGHESYLEVVENSCNTGFVNLGLKLGKETRPELHCGICGEHGGDPVSVEFCHDIGLDYVSCSPFRVPIARLAAAQSNIKNPRS